MLANTMTVYPPKENDTILLLITPQKRLRLVFRAIYFVVSLSKKRVANNTAIFSQSLGKPSYVSIDVSPIVNDDHELVFDVDKEALSHLVSEKNCEALRGYGGVSQVAKILATDMKTGISRDEVKQRADAFGPNTYKKPHAKCFMIFVLEGLKDPTIIILLVCAVLSLGFGMKQRGPKEGWYDGGSIIVAVILVLAVSGISNFKQSRQFLKLSKESNNIKVEVVRDARRQKTSIFDIVVGDIVCLKIGDQVPADGLFINGHSLKVDESSMTGESESVNIDETRNPFLLAGTKVADGYGRMLVTSVGMNTTWGQLMTSASHVINEQTPLQNRLDKLTSYIGKAGLFVATLVLIILIIRYFTGNTRNEKGLREYNGGNTRGNDIINSIVRIVAAAVTIVVVAIPEGLPLAVTLTLAYSMKQMMADHAMVRKLSACETMGSTTTICTDKTGTLTLNQMKVTEFWIGKEAMHKRKVTETAPKVLEMLQACAGLNTTGEVYKCASSPIPEIFGSPTESAILSWAVLDMATNIDELKQGNEILQVEAFNSEKKKSGVVARNTGTNTVYAYWKGAAEMILAKCSNYYARNGRVVVMDDKEMGELESVIEAMADKSLRCIAFACKQLDDESHLGNNKLDETQLTLIGLVGLKDPCRPGVRAAVESCRNAGVNIKMVTGDNPFTAKSIALECGILKFDEDFGHAIIDGVTFRNYSHEERMKSVDRIHVMARSSPFDKLLMVQCLKQKGYIVAVTGDGTNDAPALKEADIGLSMGIQGTEVAKESSDIVILDDNFNTILTVLRWGRCVYNNIQKFIQFQLTVNIAALVINLVAALSSGEVPLTAVQLLWVNLIMDTLGALALATEQPTEDLMTKKPIGRTEPLITYVMWRNLIAQAIYQVVVLLILQFRGSTIFGVNKAVKETLIFNSFVLCQIFNEFNARKLEEKNIFKGIHKNKLFLVIVGITIVLQIVMVEFLKNFADTERLSWWQWAACIGIAVMSWPIGWLVKCIPTASKPLTSHPPR